MLGSEAVVSHPQVARAEDQMARKQLEDAFAVVARRFAGDL